jgi:hypothetical protein
MYEELPLVFHCKQTFEDLYFKALQRGIKKKTKKIKINLADKNSSLTFALPTETIT